jgi:prolipoprotein diacylglyceryl transferase
VRFLLYSVAGLTIGARLAHCLLYHPGYYLRHLAAIPRVWEGGLASHGAAAGLLAAGLIFGAAHRIPFFTLADSGVFAAAVGATLVRVGNFFNSEVLGRPSDLPWAVVFARRDAVPRHPSQIYEALGGLAVLLALIAVGRRRRAPPPGFLFGLFLCAYFGFRFLVEFAKAYHTVQHGFLTMGQWLSLPFLAAGAVVLAWSLGKGKAAAAAGSAAEGSGP